MPTSEDIETGVFEEIAKELRVQTDELQSDTKLADLDASSLSVMEIIFAIEERFNIELPYSANDLAAIETLGQIVEAVRSTAGAEAAPA